MASTYTPSDALEFAKRIANELDLDSISELVLDSAYKLFWNEAPWKWTISNFALGDLTLINDQQDYTQAVPADFQRLEQAWMYDSANARTVPTDLNIVGVLPPLTSFKNDKPNHIAYMGSNIWRVFPTPTGMASSSVMKVNRLYKKTATKITESNRDEAMLLFDDEYFPIYLSAVLYYSFSFSDDPRAGGASLNGNSIAYSGQLGIFKVMCAELKPREALPLVLNPLTEPRKTM